MVTAEAKTAVLKISARLRTEKNFVVFMALVF
jgi:hypothetical protein